MMLQSNKLIRLWGHPAEFAYNFLKFCMNRQQQHEDKSLFPAFSCLFLGLEESEQGFLDGMFSPEPESEG
jgi:hypothetical protein